MARNEDAFFKLKHIALCRVELPQEDVTKEDLFNFAKWQICKKRNLLWNDPKFDDYTLEEILIEHFTILFEENDELRNEFSSKLRKVPDATVEWFEAMEKQYIEDTKKSIEESPEKGEFDDKF